MPATPSTLSAITLDQARFRTDELADQTIANILGPWPLDAEQASQWHNLGLVNQQFARWQNNASLDAQLAAELPPEVSQALHHYLQQGQILPRWADPEKILRAENLFYEHGVLSCILLFCSSLPECYVIPDLAAVLGLAGQLDQRTEHRVRATAAMIFPVMLEGGLTTPNGSGIAQILKVRLIHATIRNLILRGNPQLVAQDIHAEIESAGKIPAMASTDSFAHSFAHSSANSRVNSQNVFQRTLFAHGWDVQASGQPCNQEELAYTLLTFSYVFLRSMRKLGIGLSREDEIAYLHTWNVVGYVLGIDSDLLVHDMDAAEALFSNLQARGRSRPLTPDPRPSLGQALMQAMENVIPLELFKPFPSLMTRYLCGEQSAQDIGISKRSSLLTRWLFVALFGLVSSLDRLMRKFLQHFSLARFIVRVIGRRFLTQLLLDQTRPLNLPTQLTGEIHSYVQHWQSDPRAPKWLNVLEKRWGTPKTATKTA